MKNKIEAVFFYWFIIIIFQGLLLVVGYKFYYTLFAKFRLLSQGCREIHLYTYGDFDLISNIIKFSRRGKSAGESWCFI